MAEMTTTSSTIAPKAQIDRFELIEQLTRGTLGVVHKANDTKTNRIVALRFFDLPDWIEDPNGRLQKILAEARNASALNHANITRLVGGGHKELKIYLASDFIEGPTLRELMVSRQLSLDEILGIAKQMLAALDYAFEKGLIHQCFNPSNLKVLRDGSVKVMDFGVIPDRNIISPSPTKKIENAHYWSPEQVKNKPLERASKILVTFCPSRATSTVLWSQLKRCSPRLSPATPTLSNAASPAARRRSPKSSRVTRRWSARWLTTPPAA